MLRKHQARLWDIVKRMCASRLVEPSTLLAHVFPGGGKSVLPVIAGAELIRHRLIDKICIVVPRLSLKRQGALAFHNEMFRQMLNHSMEIMEASNDTDPSRGNSGYITTYQSLAADGAGINAAEFKRHRYLLVPDEIHHVAEGSSFHHALEPLWNLAAARLPLTGTLDRNEGDRIAFLNYAAPDLGGTLRPEVDIAYGLSDAIREKAIIPLTFHHVDGEVTYIDKSGQQVWLGTLNTCESDARDGVYAAINTAYADHLLSDCVKHWLTWRSANPRAKMLVVCATIQQAKRVLTQLLKMGIKADLATSDDDRAQDVIRRFREHGGPDVLVTVAMAYEGLDVPALTHLACLTHIRSFPWLMQMLGRVMRYDTKAGAWENQHAFAFVPDDPLMQKAIEYVRREQTIGVEHEEPTEKAADGTSGTKKSDDAPDAIIVPLSGGKTRERASGLNCDDDLGYQETAFVQSLMEKHRVSGSPVDVARMLREWSNAAGAPSEDESPPEQPVVTPNDRKEAIRKSIQSALNRIDRARGYAPGTMNKRAFNEAQNCKQRENLNEAELLRVWQWVGRQLRQSGLAEES